MVEKIVENRSIIAVYGLALVPLLAGVSKFFVPDLWVGYEPEFVRTMLGIDSYQLVAAAGAAETALGLWIASRRHTFHAASLTLLWLAAITVRVATLGLWDIAIRDLGLTFYALSVALNEYVKK